MKFVFAMMTGGLMVTTSFVVGFILGGIVIESDAENRILKAQIAKED